MFRRTRQGAIHVVVGETPLNAECREPLLATTDACLREGPHQVVLDLQHTPIIDSAGLELLLDLSDSFQQRTGVLKLAGAPPLCRDILAVTGVGAAFEMYPDVKSAVGSFLQ